MRSAWWDMVKRFKSLWRRFMSSPLLVTRRQPFMTIPTEALPTTKEEDDAILRAHLVPALPQQRRRLWTWGVAVLLHLLVIAAVLFIRFKPPQDALQAPPSVDIQFENSGTTSETTAPPHTQKGPPEQAQATPLPPPPPPPASTASALQQDEVRMPDIPLSSLPNPPPQPKPRPTESHRARPTRPQEQKYVFLNGMSYGNGSSAAQPMPNAQRGMNFSPPMSDAQAATSSDFSIKGNAGAGWDAALTKWVQEHASYPQAAVEQNQQGTATVEFTVDRLGHVTSIRLLTSSGSTFLDQAWFQLFADNTLPPFPSDAKTDHVTVRYTVHYQLLP